MTIITPHFSLEEFSCHDGSPYPSAWVDDRLRPLCETLETIRAALGHSPIVIDSGYRTLAYDQHLYDTHLAAVGNDGMVADPTSSQHPQGTAADIRHSNVPPVPFFNKILELYECDRLPHLGGIGLYPTFVHIDVRKRPGASNASRGHLAIWGGRRPSNIL